LSGERDLIGIETDAVIAQRPEQAVTHLKPGVGVRARRPCDEVHEVEDDGRTIGSDPSGCVSR
jgi:hypothetical protein